LKTEPTVMASFKSFKFPRITCTVYNLLHFRRCWKLPS